MALAYTDIALRLLLAMAIGLLLGGERKMRGKPVGSRTYCHDFRLWFQLRWHRLQRPRPFNGRYTYGHRFFVRRRDLALTRRRCAGFDHSCRYLCHGLPWHCCWLGLLFLGSYGHGHNFYCHDFRLCLLPNKA